MGWVDQYLSGKPEHVAISSRKEEWCTVTYGELKESVMRSASGLEATNEAGSVVALAIGNPVDWIVSFLACLQAGGSAAWLDTRLTRTEYADAFKMLEPAALISDQVIETPVPTISPEVLKNHAPSSQHRYRDLEAPSVIVLTSGTTGTPRGVTLSRANIDFVVQSVMAFSNIADVGSGLSVVPFTHTLGLNCALLPTLAAGKEFCIVDSVMPNDILAAIQQRSVTHLVCVPAMLQLLKKQFMLEQRKDSLFVRTMRRIKVVVAAALPFMRRTIYKKLHQALPLNEIFVGGAPIDSETELWCEHVGLPAYIGYGLTEASPLIATNTLVSHRLHSVGQPLPGVEIRIGSNQEICVRSPGIMCGYWNDPTATSQAIDADGFLHTGDLGELDADGYLFITGRLKNQIVLPSGQKVQPEEVERFLMTDGTFDEVCVIASRNDRGEEVTAVVVPSDQSEPAEGSIRRLCEQLNAFKRPTRVLVVAGPLPRTLKGDLNRSDVSKMVLP